MKPWNKIVETNDIKGHMKTIVEQINTVVIITWLSFLKSIILKASFSERGPAINISISKAKINSIGTIFKEVTKT